MNSTVRRSTKFYRKNEEEVMKRLGLKPTKNSGAGWVEKEDGQNNYLIAQLKSTDKQSISFKLSDFHTLEYNAAIAHKVPVFVLQFLETNELFILAKPSDLPSVVEYLDTGKCDIIKSEIVVPEEQQPKQPARVIRSSGSARDSFYKEKEKERQKWQKNSKQQR